MNAALTCSGQHGAGEKQRRREVPIPVDGGVVEDGHAVIAGLQRLLEKALQPLLRQTLVLLEELLLDGPQLLAQEVLVGQLHRRKHDSAKDEIKEVPQDQGCEVPRRFVSLHQPHARVARQGLEHLSPPPRDEDGAIMNESLLIYIGRTW